MENQKELLAIAHTLELFKLKIKALEFSLKKNNPELYKEYQEKFEEFKASTPQLQLLSQSLQKSP